MAETEASVDDIEATPEQQPQRNWWAFAGKVVLGVVAGLVVLVGAVQIGLNTGPGRNYVIDRIEALEFENGLTIGIEEIDGSLFGKMTIRGLTLSDPRGVFLRAPAVDIDWNPLAFISSQIDITSLTAKTVALRRLPEFNDVPPNDDPLFPDYDIDIGRIEVERFIAEAPVSGERRVAAITGDLHIADARAQANLNAVTIAGGGAAGGDRIALVLDAVPDDNALDIDLDLQAPGDGVIAALTGLSEPLGMKIKGDGDWASWDGTVNAELGGEPLANLDLTARAGTFTLAGETQLQQLAPASTAALLGEVSNIDITAALDDRRAAIEGRVFGEAFNLTGSGDVDLAQNAFDAFDATLVLREPSTLLPNLRGSEIRAILVLDGAFSAPMVDYDVRAARLEINDLGIETLRARGRTQVDAAGMTIPVSATASRITGFDTLAGGRLPNVRLDGDIAINGARITSNNMRLRSDRLNAGIMLVADTSTGLYSGAFDGRLDDYRLQSVGIFNVESGMDLAGRGDGSFALDGKVRARSTSLFNETVREYLGGDMVVSSDVIYRSDGVARLSNIRMNSPLLRVTNGSGTYNTNGQLDFTAAGVSDDYGPLNLRLTGTFARPDAIVRASNPGLGIGLSNVVARIRGTDGNYRVDASGDTDYGAVTGNATLAAARSPLVITINRGDFSGIGFSGRLRQSAAGPFVGQLDAKGNGVGGIVRLGAQGRFQTALVNLRARNTMLDGSEKLTIGAAIVDAEVVLFDTPRILADIQLADTANETVTISALRAKLDYSGGEGSAQFLAEGISGAPFRVAGNAELERDLWRATLKGKTRGIAFQTTSPARIIPKDGTYELLPTRIDFGQGNMRLAGTYGKGLEIQSRLDSVDLAVVNAFSPGLGIGGSATGSIDFAQATLNTFPTADARIRVDGLTRTTSVSVSQPVNVNFVGQLQPNGGAGRAVIRQRGSVIGRVNVGLTPLPPRSGTWRDRLWEAPMSGGVRYNGPADTVFSLAGQPDQRLSGALGIAANLSGRLAAPELDGIVRANSLTYENQTYGTRLSGVSLRGRFVRDRLEIDKMKAVAGQGTVTATGYVSLASDRGFPMEITFDLNDARLARSDAIAATATGKLTLTKAAGQDALLSGRIVLPETRYRLVRETAVEIPALSGVRFKPSRGRLRITGDEPATPSAGIFDLLRLNIAVEAADKLYVSGMGLESEWSADMRIEGTSAAPTVSGGVKLERGTLGFAGRSFELTEGRVDFTGGRELDPTIVLVASEDVDGVQVNVNVKGKAFDPRFEFASTPGLPEDEIIARILFGSSIANLSTIQAVQLAASLNALSGSGGGLNPIGTLRSATGIDRLRILGGDEASGRGTAIAAGQYLTDDVYIEIITDGRGFTATQLEVALTPALSVLSRAGGTGGTNVNIRYRIDY